MRMLDKHYLQIREQIHQDARAAEIEPQAPVAFDVQNVFEWAKKDDANPIGWAIDTRGKVFTIAPPFDSMWFEFVATMPDEKQFWGVHIASARNYSQVISEPHWAVHYRFWLDVFGTPEDIGGTWKVVDQEGKTLPFKGRREIYDAPEHIEAIGANSEEFQEYKSATYMPFLVAEAAISLMHVKNIVYEEVQVPPKVQRKRAKKGYPNIQFKTLAIEPFKQRCQKLHDENPDGPSPLELALHLVRGHFKDFREKGLFGDPNKRGIYWWDAHARGDEKHGITVNDYELIVGD